MGADATSTVAALHVLGFGDGDELADLDSTDVMLVAELAHAADCSPVLVTNRAAPVFYQPGPAPTKAEARALVAAFGSIAKELEADKAPTIQIYQRDGVRRALVSLEIEREHDNGCGEDYLGRRGVFELDTAGSVRLVAQRAATLGAARLIAVFDSDGDGAIEAVFGNASFDRGGDGESVFVSYLDFGDGGAPTADIPDAPTYQLGFTFYAGCD